MLCTRAFFNILRIGTRDYSFYSIGNVLSEENLRVTASKFAQLKNIRFRAEEPKKKAAVLIPLCIVKNKVCILYTLRAPELKTHRGQVSFPGGMLDDSDMSLEDTALRETKEELGIETQKIRIWGRGPMVVTRTDTSILPVIGQVKQELKLSSLKINRNEVEEAFAVPLEDLCHPEKLGYTQFREGYSTPVFLGGSRKIWGLTAMITNMFLKSLLPSRAYTHPIYFISPINISSSSSRPYSRL